MTEESVPSGATRPAFLEDTPGPVLPRLFTGVSLLAILALGFHVRFTGLSEVGFFSSDNAMYARHGRFYYRIAFPVGDSGTPDPQPAQSDLRKEQRRLRNIVDRWNASAKDSYNKPAFGHAWLTALAMAFLGPVDYASHVVSALLGWATILLVFFLGLRPLGTPGALLSAAALAVSPYAVFYARTGFPDADSVFFLILGMIVYSVRSRAALRKRLFVAGLMFGLGGVIHYRWLAIYPLFLVTQFWAWPGTRRERGKACVWGLVGYGVPFLLAEIPSYAMLLVAGAAERPLPGIHTYWTNLLHLLFQAGGHRGLNPAAIVIYPLYVLANDGALVFLSALFGLLWTFRKRWKQNHAWICFLGALMIYLFLIEIHIARLFSAGIPIVCLLAGAGLSVCVRFGVQRWRIPSVLACGLALLLVLGTGSLLLSPHLSASSGARSVAHYLKDQGVRSVVVPDPEFGEEAYRFYDPELKIRGADSRTEIKDGPDDEPAWIVLDQTPYLMQVSTFERWEEIRRRLQAEAGPPFTTVSNFDGWWRHVNFETHLLDRHTTWDRWRRHGDCEPRPIEIYRVPPARP